jgi:hypothetical protein
MSRIAILGAASLAVHLMQNIDVTGRPSGYVRNVETEPAEPGKTRADFPSRQAYRAYSRQLKKRGINQ